MKLLIKKVFGNPNAHWWDYLIAITSFVTSLGKDGWNYSHTELEFSNGKVFSASFTRGVRFRSSIDTSDPRKWEVIELHGVDEKKAYEYALSIEGQDYDRKGAVLSPLKICKFLTFKQDRNKGFCSKVCTDDIRESSEYELDEGCKYSPMRIRNAILDMNKNR